MFAMLIEDFGLVFVLGLDIRYHIVQFLSFSQRVVCSIFASETAVLLILYANSHTSY